MRFNDLFEYSEIDNAVVDLLIVLSAEGIDTTHGSTYSRARASRTRC